MKMTIIALGLVLGSLSVCCGQSTPLFDRVREQRKIDNYQRMLNRAEDAIEDGKARYNEARLRELSERLVKAAETNQPREWRLGRERFSAKYLDYLPSERFNGGQVVDHKYQSFVKTYPARVMLERDGKFVCYTFGKLSLSDQKWVKRELRGLNQRLPITAVKP